MRVMRGYGASRADLFATVDRPNLQPLPAEPYTFARWRRARVAPDYHIEIHSCWYSVPFRLIRQEVEARICGETVEIFHKGQRVASHLRSRQSENRGRRSHVTVPDHMPSAHRCYADWTPGRVLAHPRASRATGPPRRTTSKRQPVSRTPPTACSVPAWRYPPFRSADLIQQIIHP